MNPNVFQRVVGLTNSNQTIKFNVIKLFSAKYVFFTFSKSDWYFVSMRIGT